MQDYGYRRRSHAGRLARSTGWAVAYWIGATMLLPLTMTLREFVASGLGR